MKEIPLYLRRALLDWPHPQMSRTRGSIGNRPRSEGLKLGIFDVAEKKDGEIVLTTIGRMLHEALHEAKTFADACDRMRESVVAGIVEPPQRSPARQDLSPSTTMVHPGRLGSLNTAQTQSFLDRLNEAGLNSMSMVPHHRRNVHTESAAGSGHPAVDHHGQE